MFYAPRPANLPHLHSMVDNIGHSADTLARYLDLSPRTIKSYIHEGQAPRPVMYALFWETAWGISAANAAAINQHRQLFAENRILKRRIASLERCITQLESERERHPLASNAPVFLPGGAAFPRRS